MEQPEEQFVQLAGFAARPAAYPEVPPRVEDALTELGRSLEPIVDAMDAWGAEFGGQRG